MSILVDEHTTFMIQGITGPEAVVVDRTMNGAVWESNGMPQRLRCGREQ